MSRISLVVPVFNEEAAIPLFYEAVMHMAGEQCHTFEIVFINDGSTDGTQSAVEHLIAKDAAVLLINLSRNFGKESALLAGLEHSSGEAVIPIDVDLQDPVELIPRLIEQWQKGADIVLAKRIDRRSDSLLKRKTAAWFYRLNNAISQNPIEENVGDFRLLSRKTVEQLKAMPERNLFMKGLMHWVGGRCAIVEYSRPGRIAGSSKFNAWKLWNLALEGITSFSTLPLRVWTYVGAVIALSALLYAGWTVASTLIWGNAVAGYPSLMAALLFLGGAQLIGIGVLGEYVGRIYAEAKSRPRYLVDSVLRQEHVHTSQCSTQSGETHENQ
ncbi:MULTISPECIES: glycosyltransferase family 2 protein [Pseudomonas]|uniref:Glycosyltransferase family 2 protein n=1 Tax=Pseudomonas quercus TaxID=2722792 RepID=A0ABX0YH56_9PSED|nr:MULTISPECIES: glycosyltransferase family 2 protein [Pseudomonas]MBF7143004.1 glycosyltransferase family 2 protein [Pseudomonas sp. LY10J]NJP01552.1 glycosyltransferase family 2 protein [Pseudomonas quercus]